MIVEDNDNRLQPGLPNGAFDSSGYTEPFIHDSPPLKSSKLVGFAWLFSVIVFMYLFFYPGWRDTPPTVTVVHSKMIAQSAV